jgi:hypothetical protein
MGLPYLLLPLHPYHLFLSVVYPHMYYNWFIRLEVHLTTSLILNHVKFSYITIPIVLLTHMIIYPALSFSYHYFTIIMHASTIRDHIKGMDANVFCAKLCPYV